MIGVVLSVEHTKSLFDMPKLYWQTGVANKYGNSRTVRNPTTMNKFWWPQNNIYPKLPLSMTPSSDVLDCIRLSVSFPKIIGLDIDHSRGRLTIS